jgi:parallel beta-helix repeat protein
MTKFQTEIPVMNKYFVAMLVVSVAAANTSPALAQGSLSPSAAPGACMKTLTQVEPRTPISSAPYTITSPGSYYLTTNISSAEDGVIIQSHNVTLDLMGFTISGINGTMGYGINIDFTELAPIRNLTVRNGAISGFYMGAYAKETVGARFEGLSISSNGIAIYLNGNEGNCDANTITHCSMTDTTYDGMMLNGGLNGTCDGNVITHCIISKSGQAGINIEASSGQCNGNLISDCSISKSSWRGIDVTGNSGSCNGNAFLRNEIFGNGSYGIALSGMNSSGNCDGNRVSECTIYRNGNRGIDLSYAEENRIEDNHISRQTGLTTYGIYSANSGRGNLIVKNTCIGHTNNYALTATDTYGTIVTNTGALTGTDPWANFSR